MSGWRWPRVWALAVLALACEAAPARGEPRSEPAAVPDLAVTRTNPPLSNGALPTNGATALGAGSVWSSRRACLASLAARKRSPVARLASFNVRWFPDGTVDANADRTDIEWLACVMLHLDASVIAVQEFREGDPKSNSVRALLAALDRLGAGRWDAAFDGCPGNRQHVGFVFDTRAVTAEGFLRLDALNPKGACKGMLRPGFAGYFRFLKGPDLHVISVHLKSGTAAKDRALRTATWQGLSRAYAALQERFNDPDVVLLGDLNTMGSAGHSEAEEVADLDKLLARQTPPWRRVNASASCSEISRGKGALLDHVIVTQSTQELARETVTQVTGLCRELGCSHIDKELPALAQLSDHCPISIELSPNDMDEPN